MATTIGESVSRVRNIVKAVREDAFLTDRQIYSLISKYGKLLLHREDNRKKVHSFYSIFETIPCVDLIEVDKVEACCTGIRSNCTIKRTKDKLPKLFEGDKGPIFRDVSSLDRSIDMHPTYPSVYVSIANSTNFKYNTRKYYWYLDGYLYFPDIEWDGVLVTALWDENVDHLKCDPDADPCKIRQKADINIPEFLFAEIEQFVLKDLTIMLQAPVDLKDDKQNQLRS